MDSENKLLPKDYELAHEHVERFLDMIHPLLVSHFIHGYKHGMRDVEQVEQVPVKVHAKKGKGSRKNV